MMLGKFHLDVRRREKKLRHKEHLNKITGKKEKEENEKKKKINKKM